MASNNKKIVKDGKKTRFSKTRQPANRGRKKKIYTILKEKGFAGADIKIAFGEMAWYTFSELKEVHEDNSKPVIMRIVANQFFLALKKGEWVKIKEILEYTIGKPVQKNKIEGEIELNIEQIKGIQIT